VISDGLWERAFNRSPSVIGEMVKVNDAPLTIIGVNPPGFTGAKDVQQSPQLFIPMSMQPLVRPMTVKAARLASTGSRIQTRFQIRICGGSTSWAARRQG